MAKILHEEPTKKLQEEILDLLVEFDRVCRKNHIEYSLACGTLLGAVRHHGFIPWDNDADVELTREEYEKFVRIGQDDLQKDRFFFQDSSTDPGYKWPYGKLRKKNTHYVRPGQSDLKQQDGICIDVFILDPTSDAAPIRWLQYWGTWLCRKVLYSAVGMHSMKHFWDRWGFRLLHHISDHTAQKWFQQIVHWYRGGKTGWLGFFDTSCHPRYSFAFRASWYAERMDAVFEGHTFRIPAGYDAILRNKYQDYMVLPPVEKRVGSSGAEYILFSDGTEYRSNS